MSSDKKKTLEQPPTQPARRPTTVPELAAWLERHFFEKIEDHESRLRRLEGAPETTDARLATAIDHLAHVLAQALSR
jgi:hypothetical protein